VVNKIDCLSKGKSNKAIAQEEEERRGVWDIHLVGTFVEKPDDNPCAQITGASLHSYHFVMWAWEALIGGRWTNVGGDHGLGLLDEQPHCLP
jgi:hypothetical protein